MTHPAAQSFLDGMNRLLNRSGLCDTESCSDAVTIPDHQFEEIQSSVTSRFRNEEIAGERKIARVALMVCVFAAVYALVVFLLMDRGLGVSLGITVFCYACYYSLMLFIIQTNRYRPWLMYLSGTMEGSAATIVAMIDMVHVSPEYALTSSTPYIYFLAIGASVLRFRSGLCLYAGILGAAESALLYFFASGFFGADTATRLPSLSPLIYYQRSGYIFCAGLIASSICNTARHLVASVGLEIGQRSFMQRMFGKFVSDEIVRKIEREGLTTSGEQKEITLRCSDVRGFTSFSEEMDPERVVEFLNALFERQCEIVMRYGGHVDKFMGDGMLALFGAPVPMEDHPWRAARAALEIASIRSVDSPAAPDTVELGVALHTGKALIGNIGSEGRLEYTAIGDAVNTVFRMEALNRKFGTRILMSGDTARALAGRARVKKLPAVRVKGKNRILRLFELQDIHA